MLRRLFVLLCTVSVIVPDLHAAAPQEVIDQTIADLTNDSILLSGWVSDQIRYAIPFNSTSGNVVPSQLKLFGFEFGVEGVVSGTQLDTGALRSLNTTLIDTDSIDTLSRFPVPMVLGHAKIGLPLGFDAGIRFGGIPKTDIKNEGNTSTIDNTVFGIDLRKKFVEEGALKPFGITLGLNYTHAQGSADISSTFSSMSTVVNNSGTDYTVSINNGESLQHADWQTNSFGLQAVVDKQILFITPYLGASANCNTGNVNNSITTTGTAVVDGLPDQAITATGGASAKANQWDIRALLGAEFTILPMLKLGIGGEYAGSKNMAGSFGLRFQFR